MNESDPDRGLDSVAARAKTDALARKIGRVNRQRIGQQAAQAMREGELSGYNKGFRLASEFVAAIFVATIIGYAIDAIFGTLPIFMIVMMFIGFAAGVRNLVQASAQLNALAAEKDIAAQAPLDDDEEDD